MYDWPGTEGIWQRLEMRARCVAGSYVLRDIMSIYSWQLIRQLHASQLAWWCQSNPKFLVKKSLDLFSWISEDRNKLYKAGRTLSLKVQNHGNTPSPRFLWGDFAVLSGVQGVEVHSCVKNEKYFYLCIHCVNPLFIPDSGNSSSYTLAFRNFHDEPSSPADSWFQIIGGIHRVPLEMALSVYCVHNLPRFSTWHRVYVLIEVSVQLFVSAISTNSLYSKKSKKWR